MTMQRPGLPFVAFLVLTTAAAGLIALLLDLPWRWAAFTAATISACEWLWLRWESRR